VAAYDPAEWSDLFVASAGAAAALAGLVFVAVSINIERILKFPGLPERALETVALLLSVVVISLVGLIPGQGRVALGAELLGVSLAVGGMIAAISSQQLPPGVEPRTWRTARLVVQSAGTLPQILGGLSVILAVGGGLYWIVGGIVGAIVGAVANAWVLLVEILR
jgi:hypothetical protein